MNFQLAARKTSSLETRFQLKASKNISLGQATILGPAFKKQVATFQDNFKAGFSGTTKNTGFQDVPGFQRTPYKILKTRLPNKGSVAANTPQNLGPKGHLYNPSHQDDRWHWPQPDQAKQTCAKDMAHAIEQKYVYCTVYVITTATVAVLHRERSSMFGVQPTHGEPVDQYNRRVMFWTWIECSVHHGIQKF
jgi:hypothetical protein